VGPWSLAFPAPRFTDIENKSPPTSGFGDGVPLPFFPPLKLEFSLSFLPPPTHSTYQGQILPFFNTHLNQRVPTPLPLFFIFLFFRMFILSFCFPLPFKLATHPFSVFVLLTFDRSPFFPLSSLLGLKQPFSSWMRPSPFPPELRIVSSFSFFTLSVSCSRASSFPPPL